MKKNISKKVLTRVEKAKFKRKWGVKPDIFNKMVFVVADWKSKNKDTRGRKSELTIPQKVEVTLMYWREYRTMFHIGESYNVAESTICRTIQEVEDILIASGQFNIAEGKVDLLDEKKDCIVVDVMECEIERPKKTEKILLRKKEKTYSQS